MSGLARKVGEGRGEGRGECCYIHVKCLHSYNYTARFFVVFYFSLIATEEFSQKRGKCHVCVEATV